MNQLQLIRTVLLLFSTRKRFIPMYAFALAILLAQNSPAIVSSSRVQILYLAKDPAPSSGVWPSVNEGLVLVSVSH